MRLADSRGKLPAPNNQAVGNGGIPIKAGEKPVSAAVSETPIAKPSCSLADSSVGV